MNHINKRIVPDTVKLSTSNLPVDKVIDNTSNRIKLLTVLHTKKWTDIDKSKYLKEVLNIVTDKKWNKVEVDLSNIKLWKFNKLYFWYGSSYWMKSWKSLWDVLFLFNNKGFNRMLELWWIEKQEISSNIKELNIKNIEPIKELDIIEPINNEIDYFNNEHIKSLLSNITNAKWKKIEVDFSIITIKDFKKLYFWYWTKYWMISWTKLMNKWWTMRSMLELIWIKRLKLPLENIDINNVAHLRELLSVITDEEWIIQKINLLNINLSWFVLLYFWYWTKFWYIRWYNLLYAFWWKYNKNIMLKLFEKIK